MFANKLKRLREANSLTQKQVAAALGIDRSSYAYYELGKSHPDINGLKALAKIYGITIDELLGHYPSKPDAAEPLRVADSSLSYNNAVAGDMQYLSDLNQREQMLIIIFRLLDTSRQEEVLQHIQSLHP